MTKREIIDSFISERPEAVAVFGYGSGVFKQVEGTNPQIDLIFIVDDLYSWHAQNMEVNLNDYSFIGKRHLSSTNIDRVKGYNNITYFSNIQKDGCRFKYGVIESMDFLNSLNSWDNLFIAGRFHKPVLPFKSTPYIRNAIINNRAFALSIACLLLPERTTKVDLLEQICSLSYMGDTRMLFAENPYKVSNIVLSNYKYLSRMYYNNTLYMKIHDENNIVIDHDYILNNILYFLPESLIDYLAYKNTDLSDISEVRMNILNFIVSHNSEESYHQTIEGFVTNGIIRSIPYILAKIDKRINAPRYR